MTTPYGSPVQSLRAAPAARRSAHSTLQDLRTTLGDSGLRAAAGSPGLLAELDQHCAAVRDRLWADLRPLHPVTLARYAQGVRDAAVESGWCPPAGATMDWSRADWVTLRLLAVCQLAAVRHR